jgi:transglutaminase-like putative cysteine protease
LLEDAMKKQMLDARRFHWPWRRAPKKIPVLLEHGTIPWLLAVAAATTLPHFTHLPGWLSFFSTLMLLGRAGLWLKNGRLPRRWLLIVVVLAGTAGIAWQYRALFGRDPGIALLVFFMTLKPMEMKSRRDGLVLVMLGFFLLLTHYFDSEGILTGLWLPISAILLTAALLRMHGGAQAIGETIGHSARLIAQSTPFMLILFLLFPRIPGPLWGMPRDSYAGLSGLPEQMSPGSLDKLILSDEIAFRVQFAGDAPDRERLYWRGPVFDSYDGQTWRTRFVRRPGPATKPAIEAPEESGIDYTITLEAHNRRWLLALDLPVVLPKDTVLAPTLEVLANRPVRFRSRFSFRSAPDSLANREEEPRLLQQALSLPRRLNPRTRELAESWQRELADPERISAAALRLFREEPFIYTLQPPTLGANAIDDFLFDTRRGFCEHYAAAYVVLMRAAGVPARVVAGYQGGEFNPVDGFLTVRQSDAHAWAEIWLEGRGWRRIDPTVAVAPSRIEGRLDAALPEGEFQPILRRFGHGWPSSVRYRWEALNNAWDQWVIAYNADRQREVLSGLGMMDPDWRSMVSVMVLACGLVLLSIVGWAFARRVKSPAETRAWQGFCARLERFGIRRAPWEGPFDLAARVARENPEIAPLTCRAAEHFAELRYGIGRREHLCALRACARELASQRRTPFPALRNLKGLFVF